MNEPLDGFEPPTDHTVKVWRYLDFTKFVALLDSRALFFTRADQFLDPFEGALPRANIADWPDDSNTSPDTPNNADVLARLGAMRQRLLRQVGIASWHMNEHESAAMWSLYLKSDEGVAIQTTYQRLTDAFRECDDPIHLGVVQYIDFDHETIPWGSNVLFPFVYKRKSFEFERELRAVIWRPPDNGPSPLDENYGAATPIDLEQLVERVYIAPSAPHWFAALVRSVLARYQLDLPVEQSKLGESPIF